MNIASFFSGCGGMDLGFENAGFNVEWANDNASSVWETYEQNFPNTQLVRHSIKSLDLDDIPQSVGIIGGPPCQSWSAAGSRRGMLDVRGQVFLDYIEIIREKQPLFFVAENVQGLLSKRNEASYNQICDKFREAGYELTVQLLNASNYGVPQNRKRLFFIGYRNDLGINFRFPEPLAHRFVTRDVLTDLNDNALPALPFNKTNGQNCIIPNHEYFQASYSYIFMSRNRVLDWDSPSFTIQASGRQVSIHPQAPKMEKIAKDVMVFSPGNEHLYRRLTVRECARLQTFPDDFNFIYNSLDDGYKMIGNSVPINLANCLAERIMIDLRALNITHWFERQQINRVANI